MATVTLANHHQIETKFDVGDRVEYLNRRTNRWQAATITAVRVKGNLVVYDNDGGDWGWEDEYRAA